MNISLLSFYESYITFVYRHMHLHLFTDENSGEAIVQKRYQDITQSVILLCIKIKLSPK